jgi:hypothetical protein
MSREMADKGWWTGELRGNVGVFPENFVEVAQQEEQQHKEPDRPSSKSEIVTTNQARDSITKPAVIVPAAITTKGDPVSQHKLSDTVLKADERPSSSVSAVSSFSSKKLLFPILQ